MSGAGSSANAAAASSPSAAAIPPGAPAAVRVVAGRMLRSGDLSGFVVQGPRTLGRNARSWIEGEHLPPPEQAAEIARLERLGFVTAASERLAPQAGGQAEAISVVVEFKSPKAAGEHVADEVRHSTTHGAQTFAVAGIPHASGFGGSSGGTVGDNVAFARGAYYYLVGVGYPSGTAGAPTRGQLIAAAQLLSARVGG